MPHENKSAIDKARDALAALPTEDRCTLLAASVIRSCPGPANALAANLRWIRVGTMLSKGLSAVNRYKVSERMRNAADELEQAKVAARIGS